jgi:hypothetical protein
VVGLAVVGPAGPGQGQLAEAQLVLDPEAAHGQGLERLGAGTEVHDQVGVAGGGQQPPVGVGDHHHTQVPALHEPGPLDLGQDLHGRLPLHGFAGCKNFVGVQGLPGTRQRPGSGFGPPEGSVAD